jgi:hypothetical protein
VLKKQIEKKELGYRAGNGFGLFSKNMSRANHQTVWGQGFRGFGFLNKMDIFMLYLTLLAKPRKRTLKTLYTNVFRMLGRQCH